MESLQNARSQQCLYASTVSTSGNDHVLECYWNAIVMDVCPTSSDDLGDKEARIPLHHLGGGGGGGFSKKTKKLNLHVTLHFFP